jgi:hypothetical protein
MMNKNQSLLNRWKSEGRLDQCDKWRKDQEAYLKSTGIGDEQADLLSWNQAESQFPPEGQEQPEVIAPSYVPEPEPVKKKPTPKPVQVKEPEEPSEEESGEAIEVFIKDFMEGSNEVELESDVEWVYLNLSSRNLAPSDAPSPGAWSLLQVSRGDKRWFMKDILPKLRRKKESDEEKSIRKAEAKSIKEGEDFLKGVLRRADQDLLEMTTEEIKKRKARKKSRST